MDLTQPSEQNLKFLLNEIGDKLSVANRIMLNEKDYDIKYYDDLKFLHDHIMKRQTLSPAEAYALIDELKALRKKQ